MSKKWMVALSCVTLAACNNEVVRRSDTFDRITQEIDNAASARQPTARPAGDALAQAMLPPLQLETPVLAPVEPRFDLVVSDAAVTQVLTALVAGTRYSMLLSPDVTGTVSLNLKNTTVRETLETLRDLYGYDFRIQGQRISVQPNTVQSRIFRINYLAGERSGSSVTRVPAPSAGAASGRGGAAQAVAQGGSDCDSASGGQRNSACVSTKSKYDFWGALTEALEKLVADKDSLIVNPVSGVIVAQGTPLELRKIEEYLKATQVSVERQVMLEAKIIEVELSDEFNTGINWASFNKRGDPRWSVNGNTDVFRRGGGYTSSSSQTMTLDDTMSSSLAAGSTGQFNTGLSTTTTSSYDAAAAINNLALTGAGGMLKSFNVPGALGLAFQSANFSSLINFLQTQGSVYVLSSPRIATLNNQKAVLKVGSEDYFVTDVQPGTSTNTGTTGTMNNPPTVTASPFFSGVALDVTPQIDDQGNITLHMRPSVTSVTDRLKTINFGSSGGQYSIPYASSQVKESDSMVRVRDGMIVAIGGLMSEAQSGNVDKVPEVGDIPILGHFFKQTGRSMRKRELVILLKPTLIQEEGDWQQASRDLQDRLPVFDPATQRRQTR